jgi:hypothetical protein
VDDDNYEYALIEWAHKYQAYERLAQTPELLWHLLQPLREAFERDGSIPDWAGVDLLRGWAFYLARAHRHGYDPLCEEYPEFEAIVAAINGHPACRASDRAPERGR